MSDTPETDSYPLWHGEPAVHIDFARKLERERDRYKSDVEVVTKERDEARNIARWLYQHGMATLKEGAYRRPWVKEVIQ